MPTRGAAALLLLSAIWGSSFMFIKLGVEELEPSLVVLGRLVVGALVLLPIVLMRGGVSPLRPLLPTLALLGLLNNAVPFWLLGFAGERIDSGLSAEIQASAPILTVLVARWFDPSQRVGGARLVGVAVGFAGVALLVEGQQGGELVGALAVVGTASCYACCTLYVGRNLGAIPPAQLALGQIVFATVLTAPVAAFQLPSESPGFGAIGSVVALGAFSTGLGYLLYFFVIRSLGASRAILVTYLVPGFAIVYGAAFLDEPVGVRRLVGLALVLGGTAAATGLAVGRAARRRMGSEA